MFIKENQKERNILSWLDSLGANNGFPSVAVVYFVIFLMFIKMGLFKAETKSWDQAAQLLS